MHTGGVCCWNAGISVGGGWTCHALRGAARNSSCPWKGVQWAARVKALDEGSAIVTFLFVSTVTFLKSFGDAGPMSLDRLTKGSNAVCIAAPLHLCCFSFAARCATVPVTQRHLSCCSRA